MMKIVKKVRLALVSVIAISLMFAGISHAKIDFNTCVGLWLFDEDDGDVAGDSSQNDNDGTIVGNAKWVEGKYGTALEFDGVAASVNIGIDLLDLNKDQSFSMWFKTEIDMDIHARVLHAPFLGGYRLWLFIYRNGHPSKGRLGFGYRAGDIPLEMNSGIPLNDDAWHHAGAVFDHAAKQASLYVDGARLAQKTIAGIDFGATEEKLCVGSACPGDFLSGVIDEVAVFNVALTEDDVNEIMNKGLDGALGLTAVEPGGKLAAIWAGVKAE